MLYNIIILIAHDPLCIFLFTKFVVMHCPEDIISNSEERGEEGVFSVFKNRHVFLCLEKNDSDRVMIYCGRLVYVVRC